MISMAQSNPPVVSVAVSTPAVAYGSEVAAADFDGDGIPDLVVANSGTGTFLKGNGKGEFSIVSQYKPDIPVWSCAAADFNRDGRQDLAVVSSLFTPFGGSTTATVLLSKGDGTFGFGGGFGGDQFGEGITLATADLNGDGIPDLVVVGDSKLWVGLGKGDGTFAVTSYAQTGSLAFGDFNGDGKLDIAVTLNSTVQLLLGNGDGTFSAGTPIPFGPASQPGIAAVDFNRDGRWDIAVSYGRAGIQIFIGNGDGTFRTGLIMELPFSVYHLAAADVTGDGIPDLIVGGQTGILVLAGNGDGSFQPPWAVAPAAVDFAIADFNLDGHLEIAGVKDGGTVVTFVDLNLAVVSAASYSPVKLAPNTIATAFGRNLGTGSTAVVTVQDSVGATRAAEIFFASADQVNFLVPAGTALGRATITVASANGNLVRTQTTIVAVAPAIFAVGDAGIADAYVTYVAPDGSQTSQLIFTSQSGIVQAVPINVSQPGQVYLSLFGTGFDAAIANPSSMAIGGVAATVSYAGPQPTWPGLDQVNVLLPPSLAGRGMVDVVLTVAGEQAKTVYLAVQ
jgi:uncharacterized protein (TIGR03437 family)